MATKYAIETAFRLIDEISRPLAKITGNTKATSRALKSLYVGMENSTARLGKSLARIGGKLAGAFGLAGILNIDKIAGFLTKDIKNVIEFQTAIAKVGTVADAAAVPLDKLSKQITEVSTRTGVASNQIAESVYAAITAGVSTEKAAGFVEVATKAAIGGFTTEATAIDALTSVLNSYSLGAEYAEAVSDKMLLTQNLGKTSYNDMAQAMGKVVPYASQLGVTLNELFASITTLTGSGSLKTADAMSSMKTMLTSVINPGKEAAETAKQLGIDFSASALQSKGLVKFLQEIADAAGDNQAVMGKLFGADKADMAVRILTSTGKDVFLGAMEAMRNSAGATEEAFQKMMDTPEKRWGKAMNTLQNAGISFGIAILPVIERVIGKIGVFADSVSKIDFTQFRGTVDSVVSIVSFLAGAFLWAVKTAWEFRGVIIAVGIVLGTFYGVGALVIGITNAITLAKKIATAASLAHAVMLGKETVALALLKKGTLSYSLVQNAFAFADKARFAIMNMVTGGMLAQKAATASLAVTNGTATTSQWLLNAAMTANPIGLIIVGVAALIAIIVLLVKHWDAVVGAIKTGSAKVMTVLSFISLPLGIAISIIREIITSWDSLKKAFTDGGLLSGLLRIGGVLISAVLAPVQGILEILSNIPGLGGLAGKGAEKLAELRNILRGDEKVVANIKTPKITPEIESPEEITTSIVPDFSQFTIPDDFSVPWLNLPDFDSASSAVSGAGMGSGDKNPLHGVYDISGAAPFLGVGASASASGGTSAGRSVEDTAREVVRKISVDITKIASWTFTPSQQLIPAPVTAGERTAYALQEQRETVKIELRAARGTEAEVKQAPPETNIRLIRSGGNAYA